MAQIRKELFIGGLILVAGLIIAGGVYFFNLNNAEARNSSLGPWIDQAGLGLLAPACGSSSGATCSGSSIAPITIDWDGTTHSGCNEEVTGYYYTVTIVDTATGLEVLSNQNQYPSQIASYSWSGAQPNKNYNWEVNFTGCQYNSTTIGGGPDLIASGSIPTPNCAPLAPIADVQIGLNSFGPFADSVSVTKGESTTLYFDASNSSNWTNVPSGGKCEWNRDLDASFTPDLPDVPNPATPSACNFSQNYTFNDSLGGTASITKIYPVLRVTDQFGTQSNIDSISVVIQSQCSDGKDNDGDSQSDYPNDSGCSSLSDEDENSPPVVNAGSNKSIYESNSVVFLDASYSDPENNGPFTFNWSCANLSNNTVLNPTYNAPSVSSDTQYTCILTVTDAKGSSGSDSLIVTVKNLFDFTINANPSNLFATIGVSGNAKSSESNITISPLGGFEENVTLIPDVSSIPGATATIVDADKILSHGEYSGGTQFYVTILSDTAEGTYAISVCGTSASFPDKSKHCAYPNMTLEIKVRDPDFREVLNDYINLFAGFIPGAIKSAFALGAF